jgi:DNA-binding transcriptional LysR family regulator
MRSVVARSASANPNISFQFVDVTRPADGILEDNDLDLILLPEVLPTEHPRERLYEETWVIVAAADNAALGDVLSVAELKSSPHAIYESAGLRTHAELTLASLGEGYRSVVMSNDFLTIFHLIPGSTLVACVQGSIARELAEPNGLRLVEPPVPLPGFGIDMVWNPRKAGDPALRWLRDELRAVAAMRSGSHDLGLREHRQES